jgi:hypothetical protein
MIKINPFYALSNKKDNKKKQSVFLHRLESLGHRLLAAWRIFRAGHLRGEVIGRAVHAARSAPPALEQLIRS